MAAPLENVQSAKPLAALGIEALIAKLEAASRDSANPNRFEKACADAFVDLGDEAMHLGGPGRTDVLATVKFNLNVVARAIVHAKSASGQLNEGSIEFDALKEHAAKHGATVMAVIAPGISGSGRLSDCPRSNGVVILAADDLDRSTRNPSPQEPSRRETCMCHSTLLARLGLLTSAATV